VRSWRAVEVLDDVLKRNVMLVANRAQPSQIDSKATGIVSAIDMSPLLERSIFGFVLGVPRNSYLAAHDAFLALASSLLPTALTAEVDLTPITHFDLSVGTDLGAQLKQSTRP
jgi:hypothetical protein